jgi:small subunit ribosomal protein S21
MSKIIVKENELEMALKRFTRITSENKRVVKKHEYYLRPGLKAVEKSKDARKFNIQK